MYIGLFIYAGLIIRYAFDYLDKQVVINAQIIKSWVLAFIVASLFYVINIITTLEQYAGNDYSLAMFMLFFVFVGYLPAHLFVKVMSFFQKKTEEKLG